MRPHSALTAESAEIAARNGGCAVSGKNLHLSLALALRVLFNYVFDAGISRINNEVGWFFLR